MCENHKICKIQKKLQPGRDKVRQYVVLQYGFDYLNKDVYFTIDFQNTQQPITRFEGLRFYRKELISGHFRVFSKQGQIKVEDVRDERLLISKSYQII